MPPARRATTKAVAMVEQPQVITEIWEATTAGTVWVWVNDKRQGGYMKQRVGGAAGGSKRLRLSVDERRYNEELIMDESQEHNPFKNGLLMLIGEQQVEDIDRSAHLTDVDLNDLIELRDPDLFRSTVEEIPHELVLRRLAALAESRGTAEQNEFLSELLRERYPIGGTQTTVQEIMDEEERSSGTRLSG